MNGRTMDQCEPIRAGKTFSTLSFATRCAAESPSLAAVNSSLAALSSAVDTLRATMLEALADLKRVNASLRGRGGAPCA